MPSQPAQPLPPSAPQRTLERLRDICASHSHPVFTTALGPEGVALAHLIVQNELPIELVMLDTRLLHPETLELHAKLQKVLGTEIRLVRPNEARVVWLERQHGRYGMYESVDNRQRCCEVRKVESLAVALEGADAWLTGQRRAHSASRADLPFAEVDARTGLAKYNPVVDWTDTQVDTYLLDHALPINDLHRRGYQSIGCEPCTRAVKPGEHPRAGRWWWEQTDTKECGLHGRPN